MGDLATPPTMSSEFVCLLGVPISPTKPQASLLLHGIRKKPFGHQGPLCKPPVFANISRRGAACSTIDGGKTLGVVGESCKSRWIVCARRSTGSSAGSNCTTLDRHFLG